MSLIKVFNSQFLEFLNDIIIVLPNDLNIKTAKYLIDKVVRVNPSLLIKSWYDLVIIPYKQYIDNEDFDFFMNKDYHKDIGENNINDGITKTINVIKNSAKELTDNDKKKIIKYTQNLTKISLMYKEKH